MPSRLKSLELQGYKTFASRTLFEFSDQITAIVGPNGSGKSNIADSLRWVLGEQSYRLLRGRKTEDMIFSGSELRPRAGMAAASVVFDNADNWLPIDFSEVAITRRAYRDGTNEYLINGQRVRLKDVSELLAQSGLAERTYTIIGQGLVDAALSLKAEERRGLFEEAAGIGLHRSRREEALRRLETTRRNLERVEDILAELRPRLRSLERQARRAREYQQVKTDLEVLLREWYGYHWHHKQAELTDAREAARVQEMHLKQARREVQALDERLGQLRDRMQNLRSSLNAWHRQSAQLHTRRESLSRDLAVSDERLRSLQEGEATAQAQAARLEEELGLQGERVQAAQSELGRLEAELNEARSQADQARQALRKRQMQRNAAEKALQTARQSLGELNGRRSRLQARQAERQAQEERDRKALVEASQALEKAEAAVDTARQAWEHAQARARQAEKQREAAENSLNAHRERLTEVEAARRQAQEARAAVQAERARLQAQLDVLEGAEKALQGYAEGTRLLLKSQTAGTRGALNTYLEVPANVERAIGAALGEYLDAVLLDDEPDASLNLLQRGGTRGVLLPLQRMKSNGLANAEAMEGVLGLASDFVQAPPELRPVVDALLGQTLVVQDRAAAQRALAGASPQWRAVTLEGELFLGSGPVVNSGRSGGEAGASPLSRQRQLRELRAAVKEKAKQQTQTEQQLQTVEADLQRLRAEERELSQNVKAMRQVEAEQAKAVNAARLGLEGAERQAHWQHEQGERLRNDLARGEEQARDLNGELSEIERSLRSAQDQVRQRSAALAELGLDEAQAQVSHWNTQAAVAERALAEARNRLRERQGSLDSARKRLADARARQAEMQQAQERLQAQKGVHRQAEDQVATEIDALRALIDPAEAELAELEDEQQKLQEDEAGRRQSLSQAEHRHAQARILLARRQEAFETLRRRIEDDFGLVAFEYDEAVSGPTPLPLEGMVEQLPRVDKLAPDLEENLKRQRTQLRRLGAINPEAQAEYDEVKERHAFLVEQVADLKAAEEGVEQVIAELDELMQQAFRKTFEAVAIEFKTIFTRLFGGGAARLVLTDPDDLTDTGIDIEARLPGRRTQGLSLLSGGERSLTATALVFSLLKVSPTPFCVLDEVDAMLDEANVGRFRDLLLELSRDTQFVVVTHNRNTVQAAGVIYGVTMGRDSASQVVSLKMDEVSQIVA